MLDNKQKMDTCLKCDEKIGGKSYYVVKLDCIYDGEHLSKCESLLLCSSCYHKLEQWLKS